MQCIVTGNQRMRLWSCNMFLCPMSLCNWESCSTKKTWRQYSGIWKEFLSWILKKEHYDRCLNIQTTLRWIGNIISPFSTVYKMPSRRNAEELWLVESVFSTITLSRLLWAIVGFRKSLIHPIFWFYNVYNDNQEVKALLIFILLAKKNSRIWKG